MSIPQYEEDDAAPNLKTNPRGRVPWQNSLLAEVIPGTAQDDVLPSDDCSPIRPAPVGAEFNGKPYKSEVPRTTGANPYAGKGSM